MAYAGAAERAGCGEIVVNCVDRDGMMCGYDMMLVRQVAEAVSLPVVALGGASSLADISEVILKSGASAAAAGALFVFQGKHRAVLINFPTAEAIEAALGAGG